MHALPRLDFGVGHEVIGRLVGLALLLFEISTRGIGVFLGLRLSIPVPLWLGHSVSLLIMEGRSDRASASAARVSRSRLASVTSVKMSASRSHSRHRSTPVRTRVATTKPGRSRHVATSEWPRLVLAEWLPTCETLHRWVQIVGKTRLALAPFMNHWWHAALYVTPLGLTTSSMPADGRAIDAEFDFVNHALTVRASDGATRKIALEKKSVAEFYGEWRELLRGLDVDVRIWPRPNEIADATPFAGRLCPCELRRRSGTQVVPGPLEVDRVLKEFRGRFMGKASPVHFWWGGLTWHALAFQAGVRRRTRVESRTARIT